MDIGHFPSVGSFGANFMPDAFPGTFAAIDGGPQSWYNSVQASTYLEQRERRLAACLFATTIAA